MSARPEDEILYRQYITDPVNAPHYWGPATPPIEMAVAAPDDREDLGFWPWFAAFLLGGGVGFICGLQLTMWALSPVTQ